MSCPVCCEEGNDWYRLKHCGHLLCSVCVDRIDPAKCPECRADFDRGSVQKTYLPVTLSDTAELAKLRQEIHELKRKNEVLIQLYGELEQVANNTTAALCEETAVTESLRSTINELRTNSSTSFVHATHLDSDSDSENNLLNYPARSWSTISSPTRAPPSNLFDAMTFMPSPPPSPSMRGTVIRSIPLSGPRIPPEQNCIGGGPHGPWDMAHAPSQYRCELCGYFVQERMDVDVDGTEIWYTCQEGWGF